MTVVKKPREKKAASKRATGIIVVKSKLGDSDLPDFKARAQEEAFLRSPARYLGVRRGKPVRLSSLVSKGLPPKAAEALAEHLKMPTSEFTAKYAHIPKQTLARRKESGKLNVDESDRVARFARLLKQTTDMMDGDQDAAIRWLKTPQVLLEGQSPLAYAVTETGAAEVQQLIGRIEHGVYS